MKIALGNDHRGISVKKMVIDFLNKTGIDCEDFGSNANESVDYADYGFQVADAVSKGKFDRGILVCSTGIGMSIIANKVKGIRAALCHTVDDSVASRRHNDSNILVLHEHMNKDTVDGIVASWLTTEFEKGGRHDRRVKKIHDLTGI